MQMEVSREDGDEGTSRPGTAEEPYVTTTPRPVTCLPGSGHGEASQEPVRTPLQSLGGRSGDRLRLTGRKAHGCEWQRGGDANPFKHFLSRALGMLPSVHFIIPRKPLRKVITMVMSSLAEWNQVVEITGFGGCGKGQGLRPFL